MNVKVSQNPLFSGFPLLLDPLMWSPTVPPFERYFQELSLLPSPIHLAEFSDELWSEVDV